VNLFGALFWITVFRQNIRNTKGYLVISDDGCGEYDSIPLVMELFLLNLSRSGFRLPLRHDSWLLNK